MGVDVLAASSPRHEDDGRGDSRRQERDDQADHQPRPSRPAASGLWLGWRCPSLGACQRCRSAPTDCSGSRGLESSCHPPPAGSCGRPTAPSVPAFRPRGAAVRGQGPVAYAGPEAGDRPRRSSRGSHRMGLARLRPFPEREVSAGGWIAEQMRADLVAGFVGHLDRLAPDLIVDDDIYGRDRLTAAVEAKDLGALSDDAEWTQQFLWWNSETQSNWRDGWLRHAFLVGDEDHREAARAYVEAVLATQDDDGYLGIYAPDLRFPRGRRERRALGAGHPAARPARLPRAHRRRPGAGRRAPGGRAHHGRLPDARSSRARARGPSAPSRPSPGSPTGWPSPMCSGSSRTSPATRASRVRAVAVRGVLRRARLRDRHPGGRPAGPRPGLHRPRRAHVRALAGA